MTQEDKIRKLIELESGSDSFYQLEEDVEVKLNFEELLNASKRISDWHTTELNRRIEEVIKTYANKVKDDINNGVEYNKKNYNHNEITKVQVFAYLDHWIYNLKQLLNEGKDEQ